jgi:hypothetical protein
MRREHSLVKPFLGIIPQILDKDRIIHNLIILLIQKRSGNDSTILGLCRFSYVHFKLRQVMSKLLIFTYLPRYKVIRVSYHLPLFNCRLTPDEQSQSGSIWNQLPCFSRNWELQVNFKVSGKGKDLFGDGFAIWYDYS